MASNGLIQQMVENPGMPIRQPSVAVLTVDSADRQRFTADGFRDDASPVNNLYINRGQPTLQGYFTRIALTELNMKWAIPNVNAYNNTFTVFVEAIYTGGYEGEITCTITEGFYTPTQLATALATALNTTAQAAPYNILPADFLWNVRYNPVEQGGNTNSFVIENVAGVFPANNPFTIIPKNVGSRDDLLNLMGFSGLPEGVSPKFYGSFASMLYTPYFDIVSSQLTKKQQVRDNSTSFTTGQNLLARIYIAPDGIQVVPSTESSILGCRPFTIYKEFKIPKQIFWDTKEFLNVIDLQLIDYKGNILYETISDKSSTIPSSDTFVGSGSVNWQLTLQVSEI